MLLFQDVWGTSYILCSLIALSCPRKCLNEYHCKFLGSCSNSVQYRRVTTGVWNCYQIYLYHNNSSSAQLLIDGYEKQIDVEVKIS